MEVSLDHPKYSMNPVDVCGCDNWRTTNLYNVLNPPGGGEGGIPGNSWWRVPPGSPNPDPISDQNVIFHTRFQTRPLVSIPVIRPGL